MKPLFLFLLALASFDPSVAGVEPSAQTDDAVLAETPLVLECVVTEPAAPAPSFTCNQRSCSPGPAGDSACRASGCAGGCGYGSCLAF